MFRPVPFITFVVLAFILGFFNSLRTGLPMLKPYQSQEKIETNTVSVASTSADTKVPVDEALNDTEAVMIALLPKDVKVIRLAGVEKAVKKKSHIIVDARPQAYYDKGHIETAISLPVDDPGVIMQALDTQLKIDEQIIIYCDGGECDTSIELANMLTSYNFTNLSVYFGGWLEWSKTRQKR